MVVWIALTLTCVISARTILASRGTIPNNGLVGIRTRAVQKNAASWTVGHRAAVPIMLVTSGLVAIGCALTLISAAVDSASSVDPASSIDPTSNTEGSNQMGLGLIAIVLVGTVCAAVRASLAAKRIN